MTRDDLEKAGLRPELGPEVVRQLLPHRRPMLFVDTIWAYDRGGAHGRPQLWARRHISANEDVFAGHFPGLALWPGIYTIEGLGQSCFLLEALLAMQAEWEQQSGDPAEVIAALQNLEHGYQLSPRYRPQASQLLQQFQGMAGRIGISASVEIRFLHAVFAGQCLDYHVVRSHVVDQLMRFEVEASVQGRPVARGTMTGALGARVSALLPPES